MAYLPAMYWHLQPAESGASPSLGFLGLPPRTHHVAMNLNHPSRPSESGSDASRWKRRLAPWAHIAVAKLVLEDRYLSILKALCTRPVWWFRRLDLWLIDKRKGAVSEVSKRIIERCRAPVFELFVFFCERASSFSERRFLLQARHIRDESLRKTLMQIRGGPH